MNKATRFAAAVVSLVCMVSFSSAPATAVVTTLKDCAFGTAQVFDVKYNFDGGTLNVSETTRPYGNVPDDQLAESDWQTGYYVQFVDSVSNAGTLALERFDSSNVSQGLLDTSGSFAAYGDDFIFYLGGDYYGTLITTGYGYDYGASASLSITEENPTTAEMLAYTNCLETPLAAGERRDPASGGGGGGRDADRLASTGVSGYDPALAGSIAVMVVIVGAGAVLRRRIRG
jgi:hypothetical protein